MKEENIYGAHGEKEENPGTTLETKAQPACWLPIPDTWGFFAKMLIAGTAHHQSILGRASLTGRITWEET